MPVVPAVIVLEVSVVDESLTTMPVEIEFKLLTAPFKPIVYGASAPLSVNDIPVLALK
jgi:hypothetical protein